jgi:hypothetical protein
VAEFEVFRLTEHTGSCTLCGAVLTLDKLLDIDGWTYLIEDTEDPGTPISLCVSCQADAYRAVLAAEYDQAVGSDRPDDA